MSTLAVNNITEVGGAEVVTSGVLDSGSLPTGTVLQVVSTHKNDSFSAGSVTTTPTAVTGLSATITPISTSSKILVFVVCHASNDGAVGSIWNTVAVERNGTKVGSYVSDANRAAFTSGYLGNTSSMGPVVWNYLDSPSTTSSLTYQVLVGQNATGPTTVYVNISPDSNNKATSSITLMEVAG